MHFLNTSLKNGLSSTAFLVLQVKERPDVGVYIKDLSAYVVNNADDMDRIMTLGHKNRKFCGSDVPVTVSGLSQSLLCMTNYDIAEGCVLNTLNLLLLLTQAVLHLKTLHSCKTISYT